MYAKTLILCITLASASTASLAGDDAAVLDTTVLRGDQEQPRILYILPWQPPTDIDVARFDPPPPVALDGLLEPIDRDAFQQQLLFRERLRKHSDLFGP